MELERYSKITKKNPREIVLLRGSGCKWRRCSFCDYHLDFSFDQKANDELNFSILKKVSGEYHHLEVINSGSFIDLGEGTLLKIIELCKEKKITILHVECHWMHRDAVAPFRKKLEEIGVELKVKIGVETFNYDFREKVLFKGIDEKDPAKIAAPFNEVCLLFGITGQSCDSMKSDIEIGLRYFERLCINIMIENSTKIHPDRDVIESFMNEVYPDIKENNRIDILLNNIDYGVGAQKE